MKSHGRTDSLWGGKGERGGVMTRGQGEGEGVGHDHGRRTGGWGKGVRGGATSLQTQRPEWAACVDPGARTAPRRGRDFRQGHQLEQAAQGGPVDHQGAPARAPRRGPAVRCRGILTTMFPLSFIPF